MSPKPLNRLNKQLAKIKNISRNEADLLIKKGVVTVNGIVAKIGDLISNDDKIKVSEGNIVHDYFLYNKVSGESINEGELADFLAKTKTFVSNPLSKEEAGLLILTNDGRLGEYLKNSYYEREYILETDSPIKPTFLNRLEKGFFYQSIKFFSKKIKPINDTEIQLVFKKEKRNFLLHITSVFGYNNVKINRTRIANLRTDTLKPDEIRSITKHDLEVFFQIIKYRTNK